MTHFTKTIMSGHWLIPRHRDHRRLETQHHECERIRHLGYYLLGRQVTEVGYEFKQKKKEISRKKKEKKNFTLEITGSRSQYQKSQMHER
jgi:hypothetical protein